MKPRHSSTRGECVCGRRPVAEVLRANRRHLHELLLLDTARDTPDIQELRQLAQARGIPVRPATQSVLEKLTQGAHHQGVVLQCGAFPYTGVNDAMIAIGKTKTPLVLLLDSLEDPQNLGSLLRTACAVGATAVFIPEDRAVGVTPAAVRASAGASEHCRVVRVTNLVRAMKELQESGLWLIGLDTEGDTRPYTQIDMTGAIGIVVGSEGHGLRRLVHETCDFIATIPMPGEIASLNAGVAGGVCLFEVLRQREAAKK